MNLEKKRIKFLNSFSKSVVIYNYDSSKNQKERLANSLATLNIIWNYWNNFWRYFWITHVRGGRYFNNIQIKPITYNGRTLKKYNELQSTHYLLSKIKNNRHQYKESFHYQRYENFTWGAYKSLEKMAYALYEDNFNQLNSHSHLLSFLNILGNYKNQIEDFQIIRNSLIHLNQETISSLKNLINTKYIIGNQMKLIDVLEMTEINSQMKCFNYLTDNMRGLILNL